jgi:hypothetical protein
MKKPTPIGVLFVLCVIAFTFMDAVIIRDLWLWFAVPNLGLPVLSTKAAYGLNLLVMAFRMRPSSDGERSSAEEWKQFGKLVSLMLAAWAIGHAVFVWW